MVGVSAALHLLKRGRNVVLIDRHDTAGEETSYGNGGLIECASVFPYMFPRDLGQILRYAFLRAPQVRFDHFSCETRDWAHLRDWADHMARVGVDLCWGVGRHGPGNDTFFMVRDTEGNLGEISSDLESCEPGRPVGTWPHRPQTLNQWGVALMRS